MTAKSIWITVLAGVITIAVCHWAVSRGYVADRIYGTVLPVTVIVYLFVKIAEENLHF